MDDDDDHTGDEGSTVDAYSISGVVTRTEAATPVGDGIGTLYVAVFDDCELTAALAGAAVIPSADFGAADASVAYEVPDLPPGDYAIALFLDDDLDADPMMPVPDPGDLVYADIAGDGVLSCIDVTVEDEDVEDLGLSLTVVAPG